MRLHEDKDAFLALLYSIGERTRIREDIIEKDYYVTMLLSELAEKQDALPAYFKGGTALYKALGDMIRFSEDIDLTVETKDCSKSQGKVRLEKATNGYTTLSRTADKERESNKRGSITSVYEYTPVTVVDATDELQRFGYVKVEATSFTISEPFEPMMIAPLLYEKATAEERKILEAQYGVKRFPINTIRLERIFADKILAAEFYYQRELYFDVAKHMFDLAIMMEQPQIKILQFQPEILVEMLHYKRMEEQERIGSDLAQKPFSEFCLFAQMRENPNLESYFMKMQRIYIFDESAMLTYDEAVCRLEKLYNFLLSLDEGLEIEDREDLGFKLTL